eukprot:CAMPEP_0119534844 /NCGR_PEP_ID=MMETSP1344-20130328/48007_1 /TAXON_ID=236787 /ORGANISM="Florenciella parvula, Strain CCMP2471" /LENGTH=560 /DNA_ID=CAMNT_0007576251 /DNA_START=77 /DNA_END=1755 /DNA_ORIENTATION=-
MTEEELSDSVAKAQSASDFGRSVVDGSSSFTMEYIVWGGRMAAILNYGLGCLARNYKLFCKCHDSQAQLMNETKSCGNAHSVSVSRSRPPSRAVRIGIHCVLRWLLVGLSLGAHCVVPLEPGGAHGQLNTTNDAFSVESEPRQLEECPFTLNMVDSWGDGWSGAEWTWTEDSTNSDADTGTLDTGASGTAPLCGDGCYTLSVGDGSFPSEVSWTIVKDDTGQDEASGGAGESATVCSGAQPSPLPTTSPVPTVLPPTPMPTIKPTPSPTTAMTVSTFDDLSDAITNNGNNAQINVVGNITFDAAITISAAVNVAIRSSVGAVLIGGDIGAGSGGLFRIEGASDVTFTGLGFKSGSASNWGGCLFVTESSNVEVEDADFVECIAQWGGGMALYDSSSATVSGTRYTSCSAASSTGISYGGGMYLDFYSSATVSGTSYTSCSATGQYGQGGGMYLYESTATLIDLAAQDNHAYGVPSDIFNSGGSSFTCATSCTVGQYGDCQDEAYTSDASYKCYVNCGGCHDCPAGTSNNEVGSTTNSSCQACPTGFASTNGATSCTSCEA